ncbi:unnamed protein product [Pseudo-nitzschia multistriata]|uniref:Proteasome endopeptidase complex n=1 Tax=Pseudo-nitzschia multistriata TaxID=183589 RepID=A0A448ZG66_9STRA|nr:unnamed protein product [Pseudo-nitzschia multistriata]
MNDCFRILVPIITCWLLNNAEAVNPSPNFSPSAYSHRHEAGGTGNNHLQEEIDLGTTLVAIKYAGGVVVGADTRTSAGGYVSNKFAYKINPIFRPDFEDPTEVDESDEPSRISSSSSSCVLCRSGSAADTQWLAGLAKQRFQMRKLERPGYRPSISEVAHFLRYQMRQGGGESQFQASLICAGYDSVTNGGQIFGVTPGGSLWEEDNFCVSGSGSTILLGYLDDALQTAKQNFASEYTEECAIALVTKLLRLSIARDGSSGGLVRLYVINRNGLEERTVYPFMDTSTSTAPSVEGAGEKTTHTDLEGFAKPVSGC